MGVPRATKIKTKVAYVQRLLPIKPHDTLITWSCKTHEKLKPLYLKDTVPMTTKLGSMAPYIKRVSLINFLY